MFIRKEVIESSGMTYPGLYHCGQYKVLLEEKNRIDISYSNEDYYTGYNFDENGICEHKSFVMKDEKVYYVGDEIEDIFDIGDIVYATAEDGLRFYSLVVVDCDQESLTVKSQYGVLYKVTSNHDTKTVDISRADGGTCHIKVVNVDYSLMDKFERFTNKKI